MVSLSSILYCRCTLTTPTICQAQFEKAARTELKYMLNFVDAELAAPDIQVTLTSDEPVSAVLSLHSHTF